MNALQRPTDFFSEREIASLRRLSPWRAGWSLLQFPYYRLKRGSYRDMLAVAVSG
jgi:hypothetical protein